MCPEALSSINGFPNLFGSRSIVTWRCELDAVVGQHGVDLVGNRFD
jgi:hypothetical protein